MRATSAAFWSHGVTQGAIDLATNLIPVGAAFGVGFKLAGRIGARVGSRALTNAQIVQRVATKAEAAIGGTGRFAGTAKHNYANRLINRYQSIYGNRGLETNVYFNNGVGNRGFLDVLDRTNGIIYDFKFGNAVMSGAQRLKYTDNFGLPIRIIRP